MKPSKRNIQAVEACKAKLAAGPPKQSKYAAKRIAAHRLPEVMERDNWEEQERLRQR